MSADHAIDIRDLRTVMMSIGLNPKEEELMHIEADVSDPGAEISSSWSEFGVLGSEKVCRRTRFPLKLGVL